jgi:hypothetical protein
MIFALSVNANFSEFRSRNRECSAPFYSVVDPVSKGWRPGHLGPHFNLNFETGASHIESARPRPEGKTEYSLSYLQRFPERVCCSIEIERPGAAGCIFNAGGVGEKRVVAGRRVEDAAAIVTKRFKTAESRLAIISSVNSAG